MLLYFDLIRTVKFPEELDWAGSSCFIKELYPTYNEVRRENSGAFFIEESEIKYMSGIFNYKNEEFGIWFVVTKDNTCFISRNSKLFGKYRKYFYREFFEEIKDKKIVNKIDFTL